MERKRREGFITIIQVAVCKSENSSSDSGPHYCSEGERWVVSNYLPNTRQGIPIPLNSQVLLLRIVVSLRHFTPDIFSAYRDSHEDVLVCISPVFTILNMALRKYQF